MLSKSTQLPIGNRGYLSKLIFGFLASFVCNHWLENRNILVLSSFSVPGRKGFYGSTRDSGPGGPKGSSGFYRYGGSARPEGEQRKLRTSGPKGPQREHTSRNISFYSGPVFFEKMFSINLNWNYAFDNYYYYRLDFTLHTFFCTQKNSCSQHLLKRFPVFLGQNSYSVYILKSMLV